MDAGSGLSPHKEAQMFALSLVMKVPGFVWRHRRSVTALVLVAPLLLTGSLTVFALNGLALGFLAFLILKALKGK